MERAALFVDGRYTLQVREQVDTSLFAIEHLAETPPHQWLERNLTGHDRLGYDPWLHTIESAERLAKACAASGAALVAVEPDPIDAIWTDRPAPPLGSVLLHDVAFAGEEAITKLARIRPEIGKLKADALVVSDPHAWPGPSTSAAPTWRTRRCRSPSRSSRARAALRFMSTAASSPTRCATAWRRSPTCASRPTLPAISPRSAPPTRRCASIRQQPPMRSPAWSRARAASCRAVPTRSR